MGWTGSDRRFVLPPSDRVTGPLLLAAGLYIVTYAIRVLPVGTPAAPGSGFFPLVVGLVLTVLASLVSVKAFRDPAGERPQFGELCGRVFLTAAGMILYAFLLEPAGFLLCTFAFVLFHLVAIERAGWVGSVLFAVLAVGGTYFGFKDLLGVPLPLGVLPF